jgi:hypothetical protein
MTLSETSSSLSKFRKAAPEFQQTFVTPTQDLTRFVATIVAAGQIQEGCLTIEQVVFEPTHLIALLNRYAIAPRYGRGLSVSADSQDEVESLLHAAFRDAIDFLFVPKPKAFVIYGDHDEFATFYSHRRSYLNRVAGALLSQGVVTVRDYVRRL